jgi:thioredoxin reductase (NADPH)
LIHHRKELRASRILQEKAIAEPKIEFIWDTKVVGIEGKDRVKRLNLSNVVTGDKATLEVAGVFVAIGLKPNTDCFKGVLPLDDAGYIVTNEKMETAVPGVFAAGDVRLNSARQAITAAGDGATAAVYARKFITQ